MLHTSNVGLIFIVKITADRTQLSDVHVGYTCVNIERFKSKLGPTVTVRVSFVTRLQSTLTVYPRSGQRMWPIITETMTFFNPEIPGLSHGNPGISGLEKWAGIAIPSRDTEKQY